MGLRKKIKHLVLAPMNPGGYYDYKKAKLMVQLEKERMYHERQDLLFLQTLFSRLSMDEDFLRLVKKHFPEATLSDMPCDNLSFPTKDP